MSKSTKTTGTEKKTSLQKAQARNASRQAKLKARAEAIKAAGKPKTETPAPASANPVLNATASEFTDALNKATVEQLKEALAAGTLPARQRNWVEIALKVRSEPAKADDVAKTVDAVAKGDLTKGVEVPTGGKKKAATPKAARPEGKMSGLDAAAKVLAEAGEPLNAKQIVEAMAGKGYWTSTAATPHATIYAAMLIEARKKGTASRFVKTDRGLWTVAQADKRAK